MNTIYLDNAATTPIDPELLNQLSEYQRTHFGNPSSKHGPGRDARALLEASRATLAKTIKANPKDLLFTGGGTESLGMAVIGVAGQGPGHALISAVEHPSVRESALWLSRHRGWTIDEVPVTRHGVVEVEAVVERLRDDTRMVAVMLANNEVGAINDIASISSQVRARVPRARIVVDAVQALGKMPVSVRQLKADAVAITAHKLHGPKGIGALWLGRPIDPVLKGGGQEHGMRGGTLPAPLAWAFAEAATRHLADMPRITALRDRLVERIQARCPKVELNGPPIGPQRLGNNAHLLVPGLPGEPLLNALAAAGVCASAGSACSGGRFSRVLGAMGRKDKDGAFIRLCPGRLTTEAEIDAAADRFVDAVNTLRGYLA